MEIIFIKDLKNQGKKGEIKEVKDGYAVNFLIKNQYAVKNNLKNGKVLEKEKSKERALDIENTSKAIELKEKLEKEKLIFKVKTGEKDKIFGSISVKQIKEKLDDKYNINKNQIVLKNPIVCLGFHEIEVNLYKNIKAIIKIEVIK